MTLNAHLGDLYVFTAKKQECPFRTGKWSRVRCTKIMFVSTQEKEQITVTISLLLHPFTVPFFLDIFFLSANERPVFLYSIVFYYDLHLLHVTRKRF
jgi:hypothetical protein